MNKYYIFLAVILFSLTSCVPRNQYQPPQPIVNPLDAQFNEKHFIVAFECHKKYDQKIYKSYEEMSKKCVDPQLRSVHKKIYTPENQLQAQINMTQQKQLQAAQQQNMLLEQQRKAAMWQNLIRGFNNPVHTSCQTLGSYTDCTSY
jgi:hypothetical protein